MYGPRYSMNSIANNNFRTRAINSGFGSGARFRQAQPGSMIRGNEMQRYENNRSNTNFSTEGINDNRRTRFFNNSGSEQRMDQRRSEMNYAPNNGAYEGRRTRGWFGGGNNDRSVDNYRQNRQDNYNGGAAPQQDFNRDRNFRNAPPDRGNYRESNPMPQQRMESPRQFQPSAPMRGNNGGGFRSTPSGGGGGFRGGGANYGGGGGSRGGGGGFGGGRR